MAKTRVANKKTHVPGDDDVYVGRGSKYGNPYVLGRDGDRDTVIAAFREHLDRRIAAGDVTPDELAYLSGRTLVCFCSPKACHADVIAEKADHYAALGYGSRSGEPERPRLAIVGTAFRSEAESRRLGPLLWSRMLDNARRAVDRVAQRRGTDAGSVALVSGGAAGADHLAVQLFLEGSVGRLSLHVPAPIRGERFDESSRDGATANRHHRRFSRRTACDTLAELEMAVRRGAAVHESDGFMARNAALVGDAEHLLAYTFNPHIAPSLHTPNSPAFADPDAAGILSRGTAHAWRQCPPRLREKAVVPIDRLEPSE